MTKKRLLLFALILLPMMASAYDVEIDGIYYTLIKKAQCAEVTSGDLRYSGDVKIPEYIEKDGVTYSVTSIGNSAFDGCYGLISVAIPNSVKSIGERAFKDSHISSIEIPNSVTSIGNWAFSNCNLISITIPNKVTSIGEYMFSHCSNLKSVSIPNGILEINTFAFYGCSNLTSILIPYGVRSIGFSAFSGCADLTTINLPNSIVSIGNSAFSDCSGLKSITIPNSLRSIGTSAFKNCTGLTTITIPNSITSIGDAAFQNCSNLTDFYCYAESVPYVVSNEVFKDSYIEYATLYVPEASIAAYKANAFWNQFGTIKTLSGEYPEVPKCATPTISYVDGKLQFSCETEGADIHYEYGNKGVGSDASMKKVTVIVYAKKEGYENSDVATKEIDLGTSGIRGDLNGDGLVNMPDAMFIVNRILNGKFPDEDFELEKAGVRFGFYEDVLGYSVKINKLNVSGLKVSELGFVGSTLKESNSDLTYDKPDGSFTNVYFKDTYENPQMVVEVDYTLTSDDGTGETFTRKAINNIGLQSITQWEPNKNYTFIFKVVPTYLYGGIIDVEHPSINFEGVKVEGKDGMTR